MTDPGARGETDLAAMLATLRIERRAGSVAYVSVANAGAALRALALATVVEAEGVTLVLDADDARQRGFDIVFEGVWLTLTVHSSLDAVGLTAHVSRVLGDAGIACNVIAGAYHDHLVVPVDRADEAVEVLTAR